MSSAAFREAVPPFRERVYVRPFARHPSGAGLVTLTGALVAAGVAAYLLLHGALPVAFAFAVLPLLAWLFAQPRPLLVLLGASIPITYSFTGGKGGFNLSPSDLLLVASGVLLLSRGAIEGTLPSIRALRPVKTGVAQYSVLLVALLVIHLSAQDVLQSAQRLELFLLPLVVGSFAALTNRHNAVLKGYVVSSSVVAVAWPIDPALGQKNPVGQMIANAVLLLVGAKSLRRYAPLGLVLVPGLILTGSRGAVVATAVGVVVILALQESRMKTLFVRVSVVVLMAVATFALLPVGVQNRLTTFTAGTGSRGAYALEIRKEYRADAEKLIRSHRAVGIGVGNYRTGNARDLTATTDPHNVVLLEAAEGGYPFAVSFLVLVGATALALRKMRGVEIAPAAVGVLIATFAHGLVDVYWVRGTPVLSWLLAGMACGELLRVRRSRGVEVSA